MQDISGRLANCKNRNQGDFPKVLCVCSAGLLRSPSIAFVLSNPPYNCNTRAAGVEEEYALILVDRVLLEWADIIVCAGEEHVSPIKELLKEFLMENVHLIYCLGLSDIYETRDPVLLEQINLALVREKFTTDL